MIFCILPGLCSWLVESTGWLVWPPRTDSTWLCPFTTLLVESLPLARRLSTAVQWPSGQSSLHLHFSKTALNTNAQYVFFLFSRTLLNNSTILQFRYINTNLNWSSGWPVYWGNVSLFAGCATKSDRQNPPRPHDVRQRFEATDLAAVHRKI